MCFENITAWEFSCLKKMWIEIGRDMPDPGGSDGAGRVRLQG